MKSNTLRLTLATISSGLIMWIIAGLWHNLILPGINENIHPHHEGIFIMLIAYFILAFLMTLLFAMIFNKSNPLTLGIKLGIIVGILWVFPHGLAMAGIHETSILYEVKNALWHLFEQGIGGITIALFFRKFN